MGARGGIPGYAGLFVWILPCLGGIRSIAIAYAYRIVKRY
jgi:hypothetical protein